MERKEAEPKETITAGAILMLLVCGVWDDAEDKEELSGKIQKKCSFNKKMSDKLTDVIHALYSEDNKAEWKNKREEGLVQNGFKVISYEGDGSDGGYEPKFRRGW